MNDLSKNNPQSIPQWTLRYLEKFPGGKHIKLSEVSKAWATKFKHYLLTETGLHQNTARNYFKALKQTLNQAVKENILPKNPAGHEPNIPFLEPDRIFLNTEEIDNFAKADAPSENKTCVKKAFLFSCLTGIRLSDLKTLKWENLEHTQAKTLLVKRQKKTGAKIYNQIPESAWKIVCDRQPHAPSDPVFPRLSKLAGSAASTLAQLAKQAGITKKVSWHVARRSFALILLENGTDIFTVSKLLGHAKIETTLVYLKMTHALGQKAANTMPTVNVSGLEWHPPEPSNPPKKKSVRQEHTSQDLPA
jgi:site-specific recombinase XerD